MKRKFVSILMVIMLVFTCIALTGCGRDDRDEGMNSNQGDDLYQDPATDGGMNSVPDGGMDGSLNDDLDEERNDLDEDLREDMDNLGDDMKKGVEDVLDGDSRKKHADN